MIAFTPAVKTTIGIYTATNSRKLPWYMVRIAAPTKTVAIPAKIKPLARVVINVVTSGARFCLYLNIS